MNKREARLWAATAPRADMEDMLFTEFGFTPPGGWTDDQIRNALITRINNNTRFRWRSTWTPPGWTPPPGGVVQNWPLAVLATAAGLALLLGVAIGAMWLASDPFDDENTTPTSPAPTEQPTAGTGTGTGQPPATATTAPPATTPTPNTGGGQTGNNGAAHEAKLRELDPIFYGQGLEAWMRAAGMSFNSVAMRAQEPEQETFQPGKRTYVAAYQVATTNLNVPWPSCLTTDQPVANYGSRYQPDQSKPSFLYTNVTGFSGNSTVYADCTTGEGVFLNGGSSSATSTATSGGSVSTITTIEDVKKLGTVVQDLGTGVQIRLTQDVANLSGFVIQRDNQNVTSARAGELVTIWKQ